jgi:site-specific recombinase XerD
MAPEVADYLHFLRHERRLADLTCSAYERDVTACVSFLNRTGIRDMGMVKTTHLRAFLAEEARTRPAAASQSRTVAALKGFFRFLLEEERVDRNPALALRTPKKRESLPDVLTRAELRRLLDAPGRPGIWQRAFPGKLERDRLLLAVFAYAGLRRSELLGLDWDDVDLSRRLLRIRRAKGGRQRVIPIHPVLVPLFVEYYATRAPLVEQAVFVGVQGKRLSTTLLAQAFLRYCDVAGVRERKRVTPHTLRHVFASELLAAGANLRQIQELLGHKHLDSTQRYTRVTAYQLRGAINRLRFDDAHTRGDDGAGRGSSGGGTGDPFDRRRGPAQFGLGDVGVAADGGEVGVAQVLGDQARVSRLLA